MLYDGKVADTLFFSTSGGRTASAAEATGTPVPYLVSVPIRTTRISPYHDWGPVLFDAAKVAKELKLRGAGHRPGGRDRAVGPRARRSPSSLRTTSQATLTGAQVRAALEPPLDVVHAGAALALAAAGADDHLRRRCLAHRLRARRRRRRRSRRSRRRATGAGRPARPRRRRRVLDDRLSRRCATSVPARRGPRCAPASPRSRVAPRVDATIASARRSGLERSRPPRRAAVQLQRQADAWTTVSSTVTDAAGAFAFAARWPAGDLPRPLRTGPRARSPASRRAVTVP